MHDSDVVIYNDMFRGKIHRNRVFMKLKFPVSVFAVVAENA